MHHIYRGGCHNLASWILIDGPRPDDYILACDDHREELKCKTHVGTWPWSKTPTEPKETCCFIQHRSDCQVHNEPAYPNGPCDCGAMDRMEDPLIRSD